MKQPDTRNVYVTRITHPTAEASMDRLLSRYRDQLPADCRSIAIKINLCDYRKAESGATTDPLVLAALLRSLRRLYPAAELLILENDASSLDASSAFSILGVAEVAKVNGARLFNVADGKWVSKRVPKPRIMPEIEVPEILETCDLWVNFPKLKTNSLTKTTGNLKNIFAFLRTKQKSVYHPRIDDVLHDMNQVIRPGICVIDGLIGMEGQGPAFGRPKRCELLIGGIDPVAVDACAARIMGFRPWFVRHIRLCQSAGVGSIRYRLETDIEDFDFRRYRFEYGRIEHYARSVLRSRVGVAAG